MLNVEKEVQLRIEEVVNNTSGLIIFRSLIIGFTDTFIYCAFLYILYISMHVKISIKSVPLLDINPTYIICLKNLLSVQSKAEIYHPFMSEGIKFRGTICVVINFFGVKEKYL